MTGIITGMVGAMTDLTKLYDKMTGDTLYTSALKDLNIDNTTIDLIKANGNMIKFMSTYIVEPPIIVTKDANNRKDIDKLIEHSIDVYTSFYLRTFNVLTNVYNMSAKETISLLSTKVDLENFDLSEGVSSISHLGKLPVKVEVTKGADLEDVSSKLVKNVGWENDDVINSKTIIRTINLSIKFDGHINIKNAPSDQEDNIVDNLVVNIPIVVKANVLVVNAQTISDSIVHIDSNASFLKRLLQYKVGLISFWNFFTANDLVVKYKKEALTKGNLSSVINKGSTANISIDQLLDKRVGLNKIVFTYLMTDAELDMIARRAEFKYKQNKEKDELMNTLLAMNITTINPDRDIATIYLNGINGTASASISKLTKGGGKDNSDMIEMMAAALMANKPII